MDKTIALDRLGALAHETRLDTFRLLVRAAPDGLAAGDIARRLGVVQNTLSSHLGVLARSGLIAASRRGRSIEYAVDQGAMGALLGYLLQDCCQGDRDICAPLFDLVACDPTSRSRKGL